MIDKEKIPWWEFQVGLFVEAETQEEALKKLLPVLEAANKVDPEGDAQIELVGEYTVH